MRWDGQRIEGRAVVLIDDVMTSGATANAASRALLRSGAKRVDVLVFCAEPNQQQMQRKC